MKLNADSIIGEIVASNYRFADVFSHYSIDYCCQGNRSIQAACGEKNIDVKDFLSQLEKIESQSNAAEGNYDEWPVDLLAEYVVKKHHKYVTGTIPVLKQNLAKLCQVHGNNHPELYKVTGTFNLLADDLLAHMNKEENVLFPFIKEVKLAKETNKELQVNATQWIEAPVAMMKDEHSFEGGLLASIKEDTNDFTVPADGCNTYKVTYAKLKEFQEDMFLHIHLENNIIFPKALQLVSGIQTKN